MYFHILLTYCYMNKIIIITSCLVFSSCATLFNKSSIPVTILTENATTIIVNDTIENNISSTAHHFNLKRNNKKLKIETKSDSYTNVYYIKSKSSPTILCNCLIGFFGIPGIAADLISKKGYTYPRYINLISKEYVVNEIDTNYIKKKNIISITTIKTIYGLAEFTYEYRLNNLYSIQLEYQHYFPSYFETKGYKLGLEFKQYLKKYNKHSPYLSIHIDYLEKKYNQHMTFMKESENKEEEYEYINDDFRLYRKAATANLKLGQQFLFKQVAIDYFVGVGIKYRDVKHNKETPNGFTLTNNGHHDYYTAARRKGAFFDYNLIGNIKIGYCF